MKESFRASIEPFRDPMYPFFYTISDPKLTKDCIKTLAREPFGLEIGFGAVPTKVFHIDRSIPWILTEGNKEEFSSFKMVHSNIEHAWDGISSSAAVHPIVALQMYAQRDLALMASVIVHRNLDYRDMWTVPWKDLPKGHRIVFIIDIHMDYIEWPFYERFLLKNGYNPEHVIQRPEALPPLINSRPYISGEYIPQYVLDITKQ